MGDALKGNSAESRQCLVALLARDANEGAEQWKSISNDARVKASRLQLRGKGTDSGARRQSKRRGKNAALGRVDLETNPRRRGLEGIECLHNHVVRANNDDVVKVSKYLALDQEIDGLVSRSSSQSSLGLNQDWLQGKREQQRAQRVALNKTLLHKKASLTAAEDIKGLKDKAVEVRASELNIVDGKLCKGIRDDMALEGAISIGAVNSKGNPVGVGLDQLAHSVVHKLDAAGEPDASLERGQSFSKNSLLFVDDDL